MGRENCSGEALDFGSGRGNLAKKMWENHQFSGVTAVDIMVRPKGLPSEIRWIQLDLNDSRQIDPEEFDMVVSSEVIEHLENPRYVARTWFRIIKPGGVLIMSTPNNETLRSLVALALRGNFVAFLESSYPAHITALTKMDLERVLLEAGFEQPKFYFTKRGSLPGWTKLTWQEISFGLLNGIRFSDNIVISARKKP